MLKIIVHAFVENGQTGVVEVVYASHDENKVNEVYTSLTQAHPEDYLAIYDLPLDTDLTNLPHYPSVAIGKEEFE